MQRIGKKAVSKMHLTLNGCVAIRFKSTAHPPQADSGIKPNRRLALERDLRFLKQLLLLY